MPTELRRIVRLAIAMTMVFTILGPALDVTAATDLYPGAPAVVNSLSAPFASIKSAPDPAALEIVQIDNGLPAEIVAGPLAGADGLLWYQVNVAGLSGFIAEADLTWGTVELPEPPPVETQAPLVVSGTGVVVSSDGADMACRVAPRADAEILFTYNSGSTVDLAGQPAEEWQPVICAGQMGYLPARFVYDPANLPAPAPPEPTETPAITEPAPETSPAATETIVIPEETDAPEVTETITEGTSTPVSGEPATDPTEPSTPVDTVTGTPVMVEPTVEEPAALDTPAPTEPAIETPSQTEGTATTVSEAAATPTETEITEVVETAEIIGQTIGGDGDLPVMPGALASAAAVYNTGPGGLRCRAAPSLDARVLLVLPLGAPVSLTGRASNEWQPVVCSGQNGFVAMRFLQATDGGTIEQAPTQPGASPSGALVIVQNTGGAGLRCRSGASLTASIITVLPEGATAPSRGSVSNGWQPVTCAGSAGWVYTDFVGPAPGNGSPGNTNGGSSGTATGSAAVANTEGVGVRFRASASYDGPVIAVLMEGTSVTLRTGSAGNWTAVSYDGRNGFIYADYLATARNPSKPDPNSGVGSTTLAAGSNAKVTDALNFRSGPSYSAGVVGIASAGTVVRVTGAASSGFYPVKWADSTGYMFGEYLVYTTEALSPNGPNGGVGGNTGGGPGAGNGAGSAKGLAMVDYAMRYLGYPYIWATHGPNSFDCSGFTYWVVLNVTGQNIGAGTWTQWETGAPVQYGSLRPGDLVFFQNTYTVGLSHVGMYIGNDQFIHAENENTGVRISSLTSTYYATRYLGARRMA